MGRAGDAVVALPVAIAVAMGGCTAVAPTPVPPNPDPPARHLIDVTAHEAGSSFLQAPSFRTGSAAAGNEPSIEVVCTASNDRGSWTIATPGRLEVVPSTAPLKIRCGREGYRELSIEPKCRSPMSWTTGSAALAFTMIPLGVVIGIPLAAAAMADTPDAKDCLYMLERDLHVWLAPTR